MQAESCIHASILRPMAGIVTMEFLSLIINSLMAVWIRGWFLSWAGPETHGRLDTYGSCVKVQPKQCPDHM